MLIRPIQTEKAYTQATKNTYIFRVPAKSSKQAIKATVESEFKVSVTSIRTLTRKGKATRFSRGKRAYPGTTYRQDKHFAYVTLREGDKIKVFDEEPTEEAKKTDTKTTVKAANEQQSEETKKVGLFARRRTGRRGDK
jgi:large subunit ribosomal protein L23